MTDLRQTARNRIAERLLGAINQSLIRKETNLLGAIASNETAETILQALEALGWTPPEGAKR